MPAKKMKTSPRKAAKKPAPKKRAAANKPRKAAPVTADSQEEE